MKAGSGYALNASAISTAPAGRARAAHSTSPQLGGHDIFSAAPAGAPDREHLSPSISPRGVSLAASGGRVSYGFPAGLMFNGDASGRKDTAAATITSKGYTQARPMTASFGRMAPASESP